MIDTDSPDEVFLKHYTTPGFTSEVEKAYAVHDIGSRNGFAVPKVIDVDVSHRAIAYERMDGLVALRDHYISYMSTRSPALELVNPFEASGRALAAIHRDLTLSTKQTWGATDEFDGRGAAEVPKMLESTPQAWLHGDYGFGNTHTWRGDALELVVLDPSPNRYLTRRPDVFGSIYLDLGLFVACLQGLVPARHYARLHWGRERILRDAFLTGYESVASAPLDRPLLARVTRAVVGAYCRHRFRSATMARLASWAIYRRPSAQW